MDKNIELGGKDIFGDSELYGGRVREKVINRGTEASKQASCCPLQFPSPFPPCHLKQSLPDWETRAQQGSPRSLSGDNGQNPLFPPARGGHSWFSCFVAWGWRPKGNQKGVPMARYALATKPSPTLAVLCSEFFEPCFFPL